MPPLPIISGIEACRVFEFCGWRLVRQRGSHMILTREGSSANLSIPDHRELDRGTLRSLIRKSGMTVDGFLAALEHI